MVAKTNISYIVFADDDRDDRHLMQEAFSESRAECNLITLKSGKELLNFLSSKEDHPSAILLDINMPGMSGFETLQALKCDERLKKIPMFMFSTSTSLNDKKLAERFQASGYIVKPDSFEGYLNVVKDLLNYVKCNILQNG